MTVASPAGVCDSPRLEAGLAKLASWGLAVRCEPPPQALRYLAGSDVERASELAAALTDPDVAAVLCARGGYGSARLQGRFDLAGALANPKIFVGYSDLTLMLSRLVSEAGVVGFHGPMVGTEISGMSADAAERFRRFLFGEDDWFDGGVEGFWREGQAEGRLAGGCLSVLVTMLGTPYAPDLSDSVLFLEDINEAPYRIDRMLTQLRHTGALDGVRGIVFGSMLRCEDERQPGWLRDSVLDALDGCDFPVAFGLDAGHGSGHVVLPMGCRVRLEQHGLALLEPALEA